MVFVVRRRTTKYLPTKNRESMGVGLTQTAQPRKYFHKIAKITTSTKISPLEKYLLYDISQRVQKWKSTVLVLGTVRGSMLLCSDISAAVCERHNDSNCQYAAKHIILLLYVVCCSCSSCNENWNCKCTCTTFLHNRLAKTASLLSIIESGLL